MTSLNEVPSLPDEEEQERRWAADLCIMCGQRPIAGASVSAMYCGVACRKAMTALRRRRF